MMQKYGHGTEKKQYENNSLDEIFLASKNIGELPFLFKTKDNEYYLMDKNIIICISLNKDDSSFIIYNYEFKDNSMDPTAEIHVSLMDAEISFITSYNEQKYMRFRAFFDSYSKKWDVRSNVEVYNYPSSLNDSLLDLNKLDGGDKEYYMFCKMIDVSKKIFQESQNNKSKNKIKSF